VIPQLSRKKGLRARGCRGQPRKEGAGQGEVAGNVVENQVRLGKVGRSIFCQSSEMPPYRGAFGKGEFGVRKGKSEYQTGRQEESRLQEGSGGKKILHSCALCSARVPKIRTTCSQGGTHGGALKGGLERKRGGPRV